MAVEFKTESKFLAIGSNAPTIVDDMTTTPEGRYLSWKHGYLQVTGAELAAFTIQQTNERAKRPPHLGAQIAWDIENALSTLGFGGKTRITRQDYDVYVEAQKAFGAEVTEAYEKVAKLLKIDANGKTTRLDRGTNREVRVSFYVERESKLAGGAC